MALSQQFLDEIRARTTLSALIGGMVKLTRAGREFKGCCPFHQEKSASFTINDEKGFYHCFGCGAHGDAMRWLQDARGMDFLDAVRDLAGAAGLDMPAPSAAEAEQASKVETVRGALDVAQALFARQLGEAGAVIEYLAARGVTPDDIDAFGLGYARSGSGSLKGCGIGAKLLGSAGLLAERDDGSLREMFHDRVTIPIHDHRGRLIGFGGRVWPGRKSDTPKFVNSPDSPIFDKGRTLFNLHRAAPAARPQAENRMVVVEGYMDVVSLARVGIHAAVAPMGTALTEHQLVRAWRVHRRPVLLFDGDDAGRKAALRACKAALPGLGPGRSLAVALLPAGSDPDDLARGSSDSGAGAAAIEIALAEARGAHAVLFDAVRGSYPAEPSPDDSAAVWGELRDLAGMIGDDDLRAEYLGYWRARFDREVSAVPQVASAVALHSVQWTEDGGYAFPDAESDSAGRLIQLVRALLNRRAERRLIGDEIKELMAMAKLAGFAPKALNGVLAAIEADLSGDGGAREEHEMNLVLYRRVLGVRGPLDEAMLPGPVEVRAARAPTAALKRRAAQYALIDAGALRV